MDLTWLIDALKKKAQNTVATTKKFISANPSPASYVAKKISPPVISPLASNYPSQPRPTSTVDTIANAIKKSVSTIKQYPTPASYVSQKVWESPVGRTLSDAQKFIESPKPVRPIPTIPEVPVDYAKRPLIGLAAKAGRAIANMPIDIVNTIVGKGVIDPALDIGRMAGKTITGQSLPKYGELKSPQAKLAYQIASKVRPDSAAPLETNLRRKEVIANIAGSVEAPFFAYGGGKVFGIGKDVAEKAVGETFFKTILNGMKSGAKYGGVFGALGGLQDSKDVKNDLEYFFKVGTEAAGGAAGGAVIGGGMAAGGKIVSKVINRLKAVAKVNDPKITDEEAASQARLFIRKELGRFAGGYKQKNLNSAARLRADKTEPKINEMFRESLGLPKDGKYDKGAIDLSAKVENPLKKSIAQPTENMPKIGINEAKTPPKTPQNVQEAIDTVREAIYHGDVEGAKALHKDLSADTKIPPFDQIYTEVDKVMKSEMNAGQKAIKEETPYSKIVSQMKSYLRLHGEQKNVTGMLNREHIPESVFGVSSDEVASALHMSEGDFMQSIALHLDMLDKGISKESVSKSLNKQLNKLIKGKDTLQLNPEFFTMVKDWKNQLKAVSVVATDKTKKQLAKKVETINQKAAYDEFNAWQKQFREKTITPQQYVSQAVKRAADAIKTNTTSAAGSNVGDLKDISGWNGQMRDVYRNFKAVYGKRFDEAKRVLLDPFDKSKGQMYDELSVWEKKLKEGVVDLGIKKGSPESAAVQLYGEKQITEGDLLGKFGKEKTEKIKQADAFFRSAYNQLIDEVNAVRKRIYPTNPAKLIQKRQDYYRHFHELQEGIGGLINIFELPSGIEAPLSGISEYTKPKSKWLSIAQRRLGLKTEIDAVGGFINYIKQAEYAKYIDPHIEGFRSLATELGQATKEGENAGRVNNFIEFLQDFSNDLSGKTNPADRFMQKIIPGGRKAFRAISWLNSRVKANVILGNVSSSLAQLGNVPQGIASAGPVNSVKGFTKTLASIFTENKQMNGSNFLKERYARPFSQFDEGLMNNTKKFAAWMTGVLDEVGTKIIWNSHYTKALSEGIKDPVKYSDDMTRSLVAGRGIGEVPLLQKSKIFQMVAPFQLEVQNLWYVMKDIVDAKQFGKIATLFISSYVYNRAMEKMRGSGVTLDPIKAVMDGYQEYQNEDNKIIGVAKFGGRIAGEVLSNIPGGQTAAAMYPDYGMTVGGVKLPTRKKLFGREDPTRFGTGLVVMKGLQDPLYKVLPPFGGGQIKKTIEGIGAYKKGYRESNGKITYPIKQNAENLAKTTVFGPSSTSEAGEYYNKQRAPLSEKQTEFVKKSGNIPEAYSYTMKKREAESEEGKIYDALKEKAPINIQKASPKSAAEALHRTIMKESDKKARYAKYQELRKYMTPEIQSEMNAIAKLEKEGYSRDDRDLMLYPEALRARAVHERLMGLDKKNRLAKYRFLIAQKVITPAVQQMLMKIAEEEKGKK